MDIVKKLRNLKGLRRIPAKGWLGGVCAGIAYYYKFPVWLVRAGWLILLVFIGPAVTPYFLLWIIVPKMENAPEDFDKVTK